MSQKGQSEAPRKESRRLRDLGELNAGQDGSATANPQSVVENVERRNIDEEVPRYLNPDYWDEVAKNTSMEQRAKNFEVSVQLNALDADYEEREPCTELEFVRECVELIDDALGEETMRQQNEYHSEEEEREGTLVATVGSYSYAIDGSPFSWDYIANDLLSFVNTDVDTGAAWHMGLDVFDTIVSTHDRSYLSPLPTPASGFMPANYPAEHENDLKHFLRVTHNSNMDMQRAVVKYRYHMRWFCSFKDKVNSFHELFNMSLIIRNQSRVSMGNNYFNRHCCYFSYMIEKMPSSIVRESNQLVSRDWKSFYRWGVMERSYELGNMLRNDNVKRVVRGGNLEYALRNIRFRILRRVRRYRECYRVTWFKTVRIRQQWQSIDWETRLYLRKLRDFQLAGQVSPKYRILYNSYFRHLGNVVDCSFTAHETQMLVDYEFLMSSYTVKFMQQKWELRVDHATRFNQHGIPLPDKETCLERLQRFLGDYNLAPFSGNEEEINPGLMIEGEVLEQVRMMDNFSKMKSKINMSKFTDVLLDFGPLAYYMYRAESTLDFVVPIIDFLQRSRKWGLLKILSDKIRSKVDTHQATSAPSPVENGDAVTGTEEFFGVIADFFENFSDYVKMIDRGWFKDHVGRLLTCAFAYDMLGEKHAKMVNWLGMIDHKTAKKWTNCESIPALTSQLFSSIAQIIRNAFITPKGDFHFSVSTEYELIRAIRWLMEYQHKRDAEGVETPGNVPDATWRLNLDKTWEASTRLTIDPVYRNVVNLLSKHLVAMKMDAQCDEDRPMVFNICLNSKPGSGKSSWIVPALGMAALNGLGVKHGKTMENITDVICDMNIADKYYSVYQAVKHLIVTLDEVGSVKKDMVNDTLQTDLLSILGEATFFPTKADVADKGKVSYKPFVHFLNSNSSHFGVGDLFNSPAAFWRRIHLYIEVRVKPEYQVDGRGEQVDPQKVTDGTTDCVEFRLWKTGDNGPERTHPDDDTAGWYSYEEIRDIVYARAMTHSTVKTGRNKTRDRVQEAENQKCIHNMLRCDQCMNVDSVTASALATLNVNMPDLNSQFLQYGPKSMPDEEYYYESFVLYQYMYQIMALIMAIGALFWAKCWTGKKISEAEEKVAVGFALIAKTDNLLGKLEKITEAVNNGNDHLKLLGIVCTAIAATCCIGTAVGVGISNSKKKPPRVFVSIDGEEIREKLTFQEKDDTFVPTSLFGTPPPTDCEVTKNPYDLRDGFVVYGTKSSMTKDVWQRKLSQNFKSISIYRQSDDHHLGTCSVLGVKDQYAIGPWHTLKFMRDPNNYMVIRSAVYNDLQKERRINTVLHMRGHANCVKEIQNDIAAVKMSSHSSFVSIMECFPADVHYSGSLLRLKGELMKHDHKEATTHFESISARQTVAHYHVGSHVQKSRVYDGYGETENQVGQCGGVLTAYHGNQKFIVGSLVAGIINSPSPKERKRHCFGILHRDQLEFALSWLENEGAVFAARSAIPLLSNRYLKKYTIKQADAHNHSFYTRTEDRGVTEFLGNVSDIPMRKEKSSVEWYPNGKAILADLPEQYRHNLVAPKFGYVKEGKEFYSPERHALKQMSKPVHNINMEHLTIAIEHFTRRLCKITDFCHDQILDPDTCVSGVDGNGFVKSMDLTTGTGFGYEGKKHNYVKKIPSGHPQEKIACNGHMLKEDFKSEIFKILESYRQGVRVGIIMQMLKKDEPRDAEKVKIRKIRLFVGVAISNYIIVKMYFGMFMGIFMKNPILAETVGGVNAFGAMWGILFKNFSRFKNVINGDFSAFDKMMSVLMILAGFQVILNVKKHFNKIISKDHEEIMKTCASDVANPLLLIGRDLLFQPGNWVSGVLLTFVINNIVNSLYIRLAYLAILSKDRDPREVMETFDDNVCFMAGGDDNNMTVSDDIREEFNFVTLKQYFRSIGLKYTPADKTDREYKYETLEGATIFKRKWVYDKEYMIWKAPLERQSIGKMLTICLKSKIVPISEQQSQALSQAVAELSQYSREEFTQITNILKKYYPDLKADYDALLKKQADSEVTPWVPDQEIPSVDLGPQSCEEVANQQHVLNTLKNVKQSESLDERSSHVIPEGLFSPYDPRAPGQDDCRLAQYPDCPGEKVS